MFSAVSDALSRVSTLFTIPSNLSNHHATATDQVDSQIFDAEVWGVGGYIQSMEWGAFGNVNQLENGQTAIRH